MVFGLWFIRSWLIQNQNHQYTQKIFKKTKPNVPSAFIFHLPNPISPSDLSSCPPITLIIKMTNEYNSTQQLQSTEATELKLCKEHDLPQQFVCCQKQCRELPLLCSECLPHHRTHLWQTLKNIHKEIQVASKEKGLNSYQIEAVEKDIKTVVSRFKKKIDRKAIELQERIRMKIQSIRESYEILTTRSNRIDESNVHSILKVLKKSASSENSAQQLRKYVGESITAAETKIIGILNDIELSIDIDWVRSNPKDRRLTLQSLKKHINQPIETITNQVALFDPSYKHAGIKLSESGKEATFVSNAAKGPAVIVNTPMSQQNKFTFQITKLNNTVFFFPDSTIFIGVCQPETVKNAGMRRITQSGKGAYLVGSTGWCYHHKDQEYDRKNIVGWRFGERDKITVQVDLQQPGQIKFIKQGIFFDSDFTMPLGLTKQELKQLQPCISFEAQPGAAVKLLDPSQ